MPILLPALIVKILAWIVALVSSIWTAVVALFSSQVAANVTADMIGRIMRIGVVMTVLWLVVNNLFDLPAYSLTGLWTYYSAQAGSVMAYVGFFVPIQLLFNLIDLYLAASVLLLAIRGVRFVANAAR